MTNQNNLLSVTEDPEDPSKYVITLTPEILAQVGWDFGDVLVWSEEEHGVFKLTKKTDTDADSSNE